MSDSKENFSQWEPPGGGGGRSRPPLEAGQKLWVYAQVFMVCVAEAFNWALHTANYSLVNTVGSDVFLIDVLGLPAISIVQNLTLNALINGSLGAAAVATPIFLFSSLLDHHEELFADPRGFFSEGMNLLVGLFLAALYLIVIATEFMALYLRVSAETTAMIIPDVSSEGSSFWPQLAMSLALIAVNAGFGFAAAHILKAASRALKGA